MEVVVVPGRRFTSREECNPGSIEEINRFKKEHCSSSGVTAFNT
jgi:hypothetical protein